MTCDDSAVISDKASIDITADVTIEKSVIISEGVLILRHQHCIRGKKRDLNSFSSSPLVIHEGAFIGVRAIILEQCHEIGEWSAIGAGAVVTRDVEPYSIVAGVPARKIGDVCASTSTT